MKNELPIGIIAAMELEAEGILSKMENVSKRTVSGITFSAGKLNGVPCVTAVCGIGKVFAALCSQTMILEYRPRLILNTGVAGTLTEALSVGDIAIADRLVQHDMDTSAIGDPVGMISGIGKIYLPCEEAVAKRLSLAAAGEGIRCLRGTVASGDVFLADAERKKSIAGHFGAIACEMEGAAIGQVCYVNGVPCGVLRAISDGGDGEAALDYPTFAGMAAARTVKVLEAFFAGESK